MRPWRPLPRRTKGRHLGEAEGAGVVVVGAVGDVRERRDDAVLEVDGAAPRHVFAAAPFAPLEIVEHRGRRRGRHPVGEAAAGAAAVEAKHQTRALGGAAVDARVDAQRAVIAIERRRRGFGEVETGVPHQRPVSEHPQVVLGIEREHGASACRW